MRTVARFLLGVFVFTVVLGFSAQAQMSGSISGNVVDDSTSAPIAGARVVAFWVDSILPFPAGSAMTDPAGNYQIMHLRPGDYLVLACAMAYECEFYDNVHRPDQATRVHVLMNQNTGGINFALSHIGPPPPPPSIGTIAGQVTDAVTGNPIPGAMVVAMGRNPLFMRPGGFGTRTDSGGNYILPVPPDTYEVKAFAMGYQPGVYPNPVVVGPDQHVTGIDIQLQPVGAGAILGRVTDRVTGLPLEHALVIAHRIDGFGFGQAPTDANGDYTINRLLAGTYRVVALARGYFPAAFPDPVSVIENQTTTGIDFALLPFTPPPAGHIAGRVTDDSTGLPIADAVVGAVAFDSTHRMPIIRFTHTGEDGSYRIESLPSIPFFVIAWAHGYLAELYDNAHRFEDATRVIPPADGIDFALTLKPMGPPAVSGIVMNQNLGTPLAGVLVNAVTPQGEVAGSAVSLPDGSFLVEGLGPGQFTLEARSNLAPPVAVGPFDLSGDGQSGIVVNVPAAVANVRGDVNRDGLIDVVDIVGEIDAVVFGRLLDPLLADVNCDGVVDIVDIVGLVQFVVFGRPSPCALN